ncbi:hypothetical protein BAE44_0002708 [Dichanthelium oligosanthes]|uniref:Uncharacterized protein n=1 Tax=Dichanthelium oligosanthes TaxID=888268 RepID=A0A1E5WG01_9POAL|nr:hypothetical protein BAE44_0002708 [Dichanthelium oligosanthes]
MVSQIESRRDGTEVVNGDTMCRKNSVELQEELGLSRASCLWRISRSLGYQKIKQSVSYAGEVTAFVLKGRLRKVARVKTRSSV